MAGMTNLEINNILVSNPITRRVYKGCYPSDKIPKCTKFPCAYVINVDESTEPGSHWVAIYALNTSKALYYDSLGKVPPPEIIADHMAKQFKTVEFQYKGIQNPSSDACGQYAIFFIYMAANKIPLRSIHRILQNTKNPDKFVKDFVRRKIMII